jgi:adenylosuccinate synthase
VKVGHSYDLDGEELLTMPATTERWGECEPNLREFEPWPEVDWSAVADEGYDAIPENAQTYLEYLSEEVGAPIYAVGVGPDRAQTIELENPFEQ